MNPRILNSLEKRQAKVFLKGDSKHDLNERVLAIQAGNYLPEIRKELELLEKFLAAYEGTGYIFHFETEKERLVCLSCHKKGLKFVSQLPKQYWGMNGHHWPKRLYFECVRCKARWMHDLPSNVWHLWDYKKH